MVATIQIPLAPHQDRMVAKARARRWKAGWFCAPRTGKTRAALAALVEAEAARILIVCPSMAAGVWRAEAERIHFPFPVFIALDGDLDKRAAALKSWMALHPSSMIITNYPSYWRPKIAPLLIKWQPDAIVMDEVSALRSRSSKQGRFAARLATLPSVRCRLGLTGTPITNTVQDLFGIYRFIDPTVFGTRWSSFAQEFLDFGFFNQIVGSHNDAEINRRLAESSIQVARSEAWGGLPTRLDQVWPVILTEASSKRYREFAKEAIVAIEGTDVEGNPHRGTVSADLVITQAMRLAQLASGHTKMDDRIIDVSSEKIDAAVELTQQAISNGEQVALFAVFRREIARLHEQLTALYPGKVAVIQGGDDPEERTQRVARFQRGELRALILQNKVGSMAIDLAAASVGIVCSTGYSLEDFEQLRERLTGIDPNRSFSYIYLQAQHADGKPTIDGRIYDILEKKQKIAGRFLTLDYTRRLFSE